MKKLFTFLFSLVLVMGFAFSSPALANCPNPPGETFPGNPGLPVTPTNPVIPIAPPSSSTPSGNEPLNYPPNASLPQGLYRSGYTYETCGNGTFNGCKPVCRTVTTGGGQFIGPVTDIRLEWNNPQWGDENPGVGKYIWRISAVFPDGQRKLLHFGGTLRPGWASTCGVNSEEFKGITIQFIKNLP